MIVMQRIKTSSRDPSVVGPGTQRSGVPERAAIPQRDWRQSDCRLLQHLLQYSTPAHGPKPYEQVILQEATDLTVSECIMIALDGENLRVTYAYSPSCGAPSRPWAVKQFRLGLGEWVQIAYNGRFSSGSDYDYCQESSTWWYEKTVVNVGLFDGVAADLFTRGEPTDRYSVYSPLW